MQKAAELSDKTVLRDLTANRIDDGMAVFLSSLSYVDNSRIASLGISKNSITICCPLINDKQC